MVSATMPGAVSDGRAARVRTMRLSLPIRTASGGNGVRGNGGNGVRLQNLTKPPEPCASEIKIK